MAFIKQPMYMLRVISTKEVTTGAVINEALGVFLFKWFWFYGFGVHIS